MISYNILWHSHNEKGLRGSVCVCMYMCVCVCVCARVCAWARVFVHNQYATTEIFLLLFWINWQSWWWSSSSVWLLEWLNDKDYNYNCISVAGQKRLLAAWSWKTKKLIILRTIFFLEFLLITVNWFSSAVKVLATAQNWSNLCLEKWLTAQFTGPWNLYTVRIHHK